MREFKICAKNKTELANDYGISLYVLGKWLACLPDDVKDKIKVRKGQKILTPFEVDILVNHWGKP